MSLSQITIDPVANGVIFSAGDGRKVFELLPGTRGRAVHNLLREVAASVGPGLEVSIEVRDPAGKEEPVAARPKKSLMTPSDVSAEFGWSVKTLEQWRHEGKGPKYAKLGESRRAAVHYRREDIEEFIRANTIQTSGKV